MPSARKFFNEQQQQLLMEAIAKAELHTSGEVRIHLENFCFGNELKAAKKVFGKLKMQHTAERNGILIYIATLSRKIAVFGDEGIHQKLGGAYWDTMVKNLVEGFKADKKAEVLAECIVDLGKQLGTYFPRKDDDKNELSNSISF